MSHIQNINIYNSRMQQGMEDKLFFLPQLPNTPFLFVDFGCADGTLLKFILESYPNAIGVGIDSNEDMISHAKRNCSTIDYNRVYFYKNLDDCLRDIQSFFNETIKILNFSSVMHEIYHYLSTDEKDSLLTTAFSGVFDKIFIRDMSYICSNGSTPQDFLTALYKQKELKGMIEDFESIFGSLTHLKNFIHFLMKYKYKENWKRECSENYFFDYYDMLNKINKKYKTKQEFYLLTYLKELWKKEFHIDVMGSTHFHLIAEKK